MAFDLNSMFSGVFTQYEGEARQTAQSLFATLDDIRQAVERTANNVGREVEQTTKRRIMLPSAGAGRTVYRCGTNVRTDVVYISTTTTAVTLVLNGQPIAQIAPGASSSLNIPMWPNDVLETSGATDNAMVVLQEHRQAVPLVGVETGVAAPVGSRWTDDGLRKDQRPTGTEVGVLAHDESMGS